MNSLEASNPIDCAGDLAKSEYIKFKVVGHLTGEMCFETSKSITLGEIRSAYMQQVRQRYSSLTFFFHGHHLNDAHTPKQLGMQDDDVIDAVSKYESYFNYRIRLMDGTVAAGLLVIPDGASFSMNPCPMASLDTHANLESVVFKQIYSCKYKKPAPITSSLRNMTDQIKRLSISDISQYSESNANDKDDRKIKIYVEEEEEHCFTTSISTPMKEIRRLYSEKVGIPVTSFLLFYENHLIDDMDTPKQLADEDDDSEDDDDSLYIGAYTDDISYCYHIIKRGPVASASYRTSTCERYLDLQTDTRACGNDEFEFTLMATHMRVGQIAPTVNL